MCCRKCDVADIFYKHGLLYILMCSTDKSCGEFILKIVKYAPSMLANFAEFHNDKPFMMRLVQITGIDVLPKLPILCDAELQWLSIYRRNIVIRCVVYDMAFHYI